MVDQLLRYLLNHKEVSVKGIGTFSLKNVSAVVDFPNRLLHAPHTTLEYSSTFFNDEAFHHWLQNDLHLSADAVKEKLDVFVKQVQHQLNHCETVEWKGIGSFNKNDDKLLNFQPAFDIFIGDAVKAEKIIRKNAPHSIWVGSEEKTTTEMEELLLHKQKQTIKSWWIIAIILFILAVVAVWYFASAHSKEWKMQGNGSKIKTGKSESTYQIQ